MWVRCSLCHCLDASFQFVNRQSAFADNLDGRALRALCVRIRFRFFKNCSSSSSKAFNFYILRMQWGKSLLEKQMFKGFSCTNFFLKYDVKLYFIFRLQKNCSGRQGGSITASIQKQSDCLLKSFAYEHSQFESILAICLLFFMTSNFVRPYLYSIGK